MIIEYRTFKIPKRNGSYRIIEEPVGDGKIYLQTLLKKFENMEEFKPSYFAHGFMQGRNIVTCARQHFGRKYVLRIDIKDFFNSITYAKFTSIVTVPIKYRQIVSDCFRFLKGKDPYLAQGAPTSPFLSNTYMKSFDWACAWRCYDYKIVYNRYADDIFISSDSNDSKFWSCYKYISRLLNSFWLEENKNKRKLMHRGKRMEIVGVVVNEKFQINRQKRRVIRAMLHNAKRDNKYLNNVQKGWINFKDMVSCYEGVKPNNIEICESILMAKRV